MTRVTNYLTILFTLSLGLISFQAQAQDYYHGTGGQIDNSIQKITYSVGGSSQEETGGAAAPGVFYKATLALSDNFAISAYPLIGLNFSSNSRTGSSGSFSFQIPVAAELWFGDYDDGAFFVGAGFSYSSISTSSTWSSSNAKTFGPQLSIGGQLPLNNSCYGVRLAYTHGLNKLVDDASGIEDLKETNALISLGVYYLFGY